MPRRTQEPAPNTPSSSSTTASETRLAEAQALSARLAALNETTAQLIASSTEDDLLRTLAQQARWVLDFQHCTLALCDGAGYRQRDLLASGPGPWSGWRAPDNSAVGRALTQAQIQMLGGLVPEDHAPPGMQSALALPLRHGTELIGVLAFYAQRPDHYTLDDMRIAHALSMQVSMLIERNRFQQQRQTAIRFSEQLAATADLETTLDGLLQSVCALVPQIDPILLGYDHHRKLLSLPPATHRFLAERVPQVWEQRTSLQIALEDPHSVAALAARRTLETQQPAIAQLGEPDLTPLIDTARSELAVGLLDTSQRLLGVLVLDHNREAPLVRDEIDLLSRSAAATLSIALDRAARSDELRFRRLTTAQTAWTAEMAHEINGEIGAMRHSVYFLQQELGYQHELLARIDKSLDQLVHYMNISQLKREVLSLDQLHNLLQAVIKQILSSRNSAIEPHFALQDGDVIVQASSLILERSLRHLIRNALEAMNGQGQLFLRSLRQENFIEIQIANTGPAIPIELRAKLFRELITHKDAFGYNRGLGLLFVRMMIESMGGDIYLLSADSPVTFALKLPVVELPVESLQEPR